MKLTSEQIDSIANRKKLLDCDTTDEREDCYDKHYFVLLSRIAGHDLGSLLSHTEAVEAERDEWKEKAEKAERGQSVFYDRDRVGHAMHNIWANWTRYLLHHLDDEHKARWCRQIDTPYDFLTEDEKESDRKVADRLIQLVEED